MPKAIQIMRAAIPTTVLGDMARSSSVFDGGAASPGLVGLLSLQESLEDRATKQGGLFECLKNQWNFPCQVLDFFRTHHPLSLLFLHFGMVMSVYACPTFVFWKHITFLIFQFCSWRGIQLQDAMHIEYHPYLIQIIFR